MHARRTAARSGGLLLAVAALMAAGAATADAHVQVIPENTAGGAFTKLTFRVPTESDTLSTTKLSVALPKDTPLVYVSAQPLDGWTVSVVQARLPKPVSLEGTTITEAPATVTWTAAKGHGIAPGQFQEFSLAGGPLPEGVEQLSFPAAQTYSDGSVVRWDEPQPEGADEPEHPAPAFAVTAALPEGADPDAAPAPAQPAAAPAAPAASTASSQDDSDPTARALGVGGLVLGLVGLGLGVLAWRRTGQA